MPVVEISFFERPVEKKRELVKKVTDAVAEVLEVDPEGIYVILREMRRDQWAGGGQLRSDRPAPKRKTA